MIEVLPVRNHEGWSPIHGQQRFWRMNAQVGEGYCQNDSISYDRGRAEQDDPSHQRNRVSYEEFDPCDRISADRSQKRLVVKLMVIPMPSPSIILRSVHPIVRKSVAHRLAQQSSREGDARVKVGGLRHNPGRRNPFRRRSKQEIVQQVGAQTTPVHRARVWLCKLLLPRVVPQQSLQDHQKECSPNADCVGTKHEPVC